MQGTAFPDLGSHDADRRAAYGADKPGTETIWSRGLPGMPANPPVGFSTLVGSLTINLLSLGLPLVILQVYDRILPNAAVNTLLFLVIGLCVVLLLDGSLRMARSYVTGWEAARFDHITSCRAVDRLLSIVAPSFEKHAPGIHLDRLNAIDTLRDYYAGQANLLLIDLPFIGVFFLLMWIIAGSLVLVPMAMLLLLVAIALYVGKVLKAALNKRADLDDRRYNFIIEILGGMQTVKGLGMEPLLLRRYERLQETGAASTYHCTVLSNLSQGIGSLSSNLTMVAVATVGATYVVAGDLSVGGLAASTLLAGRSVQPMLRALSLWTQFQSIKLARERLSLLFSQKPEAEDNLEQLAELTGKVAFHDVTFRYEEDGPLLFQGLNLTIKPGEVIGISGGTGSGKSTLLLMIMNALKPSSGQILLDDTDIANCNPYGLRQQIAYLPQDGALFQGFCESIKLARERLSLLFSQKPEAEDNLEQLAELTGKVAFHDVTFRYEEDGPLLFQGLNLTIKPGEVIGISGGTGSGKSTLLLMIMNALKPSSGQILLDDTDIANCNPYGLRQQIAYLPQDGALFQGSILDNLTMFRDQSHLEDALGAAALLGLDKLISRLPRGYDTKVGDGAQDELPTGIKQCIVMARALAGKPRLVLFDEANKGFDRKHDAMLKDALAQIKGGPTMVLVSHRPSILALADRTFQLLDGKLIPTKVTAPGVAGAPVPEQAQPATMAKRTSDQAVAS